MSDPSANIPALKRATPLYARGEPMVWLTGAALALALLMIAALLGIVLSGGASAFGPRPIDRVTFRETPDGPAQVFLGVAVEDAAFDPTGAVVAEIEAFRSVRGVSAEAFDSAERPIRRLYRVGNKEIRGQPFMWVPLYRIESVERPRDAVFVERREWGPWLGRLAGVLVVDERILPGPREAVSVSEFTAPPPDLSLYLRDGARVHIEREVIGDVDGGGLRVIERTRLDHGVDDRERRRIFDTLHAEAVSRRDEIERIKSSELGSVNRRLEAERLRVRQAELDLERSAGGVQARIGWPAWGVVLLTGAGLSLIGWRRLARRGADDAVLRARTGAQVLSAAMLIFGVAGLLAAWLERPWAGVTMTPERLANIREEAAASNQRLNEEFAQIQSRIARLQSEDQRFRVLLEEPTTGVIAPARQTEPGSPLRVSQVVRMVSQPDGTSIWSRLGVYLDRWKEFVFSEPREANTEGGIFPVIFGTVMLTMLLSVMVVPLGVVAALYLREYARQGPLTSAIRIAINNLAGVPSIVYGVFGLGFFCYTVGVYIDRGPEPGNVLTPTGWWVGALGLGGVIVGAIAMALASRPRPGQPVGLRERWCARGAALMWLIAAVSAVWLILSTPYFTGFFEAKSGPTYGAKGMLWSALTLALLTLPVVIVATEEAIAAVPRTMREGSYGCGASKWQTIRRIVLPRAMPGIMTGMILAMARGAGEVAPLMLVGAVKLAPELPVTLEPPFVHLDRPFMHLGFHIYDVGFQSPDSLAARPIVWCTALLLILVVVMLNLAAIRVRSNLRKKFLGEAF
jgi:ABC-type phosphate transport system permease subunit/ABC-type phosphate transport system auxiliary subunit